MFSEATAIKQLETIARFDSRKEIPSHFPAVGNSINFLLTLTS